nr:helix-turn-helix domain-containing protein [uncultured Albidiferax sp.]
MTFTAAIPTASSNKDFLLDAWNAQLGSVCGAFRTVASTEQITGSISTRSFMGMEIVNVNVSPSHIIRSQKDVRSDGAEYYFLIGQIAGKAHIQHSGRSVLLAAGDMVLVDSSQESKFIYAGSESKSISNQLSVHVPRTFLEGKLSPHQFGERIEANSDLAHCVWVQLTAIEEVISLFNDSRIYPDAFRELFLKAFTYMFYTDRHQDRFVKIMSNLLKEAGTQVSGVDFLADMSASSRRTIFRIFEKRDTSLGEMLKYIRLLRFLKLCKSHAHSSVHPTVSSLIYQAGFSDISNFNHLFKANFGITPRELMTKH